MKYPQTSTPTSLKSDALQDGGVSPDFGHVPNDPCSAVYTGMNL